MVHGSVTTFVGKDPQFYVIEWDEEMMVPVNIHVYTANLTAANHNGQTEPEWYEIHDYLSEYNMTDMSPNSMKQLSNKLYKELSYAKKFETNHQGNSGSWMYNSNNDKYTASLNDRFYKCLQTEENTEQFDCIFKGSWDFLGLYSLIFGDYHYKKLI